MSAGLVVALFFVGLIIIIIAKTAVIVPQQQGWIVEHLGKYNGTLHAGFHILIPFLDRIAYKHSLKEDAYDTPRQICITRDNVQVEIDGVLYLQVIDPERASYGISDYKYGIMQLAQTTLRSEIGKIELDKTFEERQHINLAVVAEIDKAANPWGVKVLRYEIKDINPPRDVLSAMEKQMRAEREKRATILESEGQRDSEVNRAEGQKQRVIKESEAKKQSQINQAEGEARAILEVANATAEGLKKVATALQNSGGHEAMQLRIAESYIEQFGNLAKEGNTFVLPSNLTDLAAVISMAKNVIPVSSSQV